MGEMIYQKERFIQVLAKGTRDGFRWCIINLGTHPCAYVAIPKGHKFYSKHYDKIDINCHCGLTFADKDFRFNPIMVEPVWWIGWDYAHYGDYMGYYAKEGTESLGEKKWTTEEIMKEVRSVIRQLKKVRTSVTKAK